MPQTQNDLIARAIRFSYQMCSLEHVEHTGLELKQWAGKESKRAVAEVEQQMWLESFPAAVRPKQLYQNDPRRLSLNKWIAAILSSGGLSGALRTFTNFVKNEEKYAQQYPALTQEQARQLYADLFTLRYIGKRFCLSSAKFEDWLAQLDTLIGRVREDCGFREAH